MDYKTLYEKLRDEIAMLESSTKGAESYAYTRVLNLMRSLEEGNNA